MCIEWNVTQPKKKHIWLSSNEVDEPGTGRGDGAHREPLVEVGNAPGARQAYTLLLLLLSHFSHVRLCATP